MDRLREEAAAWCRGKNGFLRLPLLLWFGYVLVKTLRDPSCQNLLWPLNLGFHEAGHLLFSYFGKFLYMLGGTLLEGLMPVFGIYYFYRKRDFFAMALCLGWLSTALFSIARYAADARQMTIPLVSLSWDSEVTHDWNYLLSQWGLLRYDQAVAFLFRSLAVGAMLLCLTCGFWLVSRMILNRD
jgi:hypothetical protein